MVAISILSVLVVLFSGVFSQVSRAWITGEGDFERRRSVRALADFIGSELQGAMLPVETIVTTGKGNLQFIVNPPSSQVPDDYRNADAIFWQAPLATETSQGEIAEVGYFVKWDNSNPGSERPLLCRFFVNPSVTSGAGSVLNPDFLIYNSDPKKWLSQPLLDKVAPASKSSGYTGLFAEGIVGLWVRCYRLDGAEAPTAANGAKFDSREGYDLNKGVAPVDQRYLPGSVQISLAQIDSHYASRLAPAASSIRTMAKSSKDAQDFLSKLTTNASSSKPMAAILPGVRIYSTEIQLLNAR
jgi:hypothetical protein